MAALHRRDAVAHHHRAIVAAHRAVREASLVVAHAVVAAVVVASAQEAQPRHAVNNLEQGLWHGWCHSPIL